MKYSRILGTLILGGGLALPGCQTGTPTETPRLQSVADTPTSGTVAGTPTVTLRLQSRYHLKLPGFGTLGQRFSEEIKRNTNNQLAFELYGPRELVQPSYLFDAVGKGFVDAGWSSPAFSAKYEPALWLFAGYPFGPSAEQHWRWMQQGDGQIILDEIYEKYRVKGVPCGYLGQSGFGWFQQPVERASDLKTMKMYMPFSSTPGQKVMRKLGTEFQPLRGSEIVPVFKHGLVDGVSLFTPAHDIIFEFHKTAKHYYYPGWQRPFTMIELIINKQKWEMLTDNQRHAIEDTCRQNIEFALLDEAAETKKALRVIKAHGVIVRELPSRVLRELRLAWNEVIKDESKQSMYFEKALQSIESATTTQSLSQ